MPDGISTVGSVDSNKHPTFRSKVTILVRRLVAVRHMTSKHLSASTIIRPHAESSCGELRTCPSTGAGQPVYQPSTRTGWNWAV